MLLKMDSSAIAGHAATLMGIGRSALPVAVLQTLNSAAYRVKQETMPKEAKRFDKRKENFFRANSGVEQAKGWDINGMRAIVGFKPKAADTSHSVEDLEQQEEGGDIAGRAFIPLAAARTGNVWNKMVRAKNRLSTMRQKIVNTSNAGPKNAETLAKQFVKSAVHAGKGGFLLGNKVNDKGNRLLYYINSIKRVNGDTKVNSTAIYAVKAGRQVHVKETHFMRKASLTSRQGMEADFIKNAEKQLLKYKK